MPAYLQNAVNLFRYNRKVFITPPWKEIYQHDEYRKQSWDEAVATFENIAAAYIECGYELIEMTEMPVLQRVNLILNQI